MLRFSETRRQSRKSKSRCTTAQTLVYKFHPLVNTGNA